MEPHVSDKYEVGAILEHSWGYDDQTNIDYFVIVKRSETPKAIWLTLLPMTIGSREETMWAQGTCVPGVVKADAKPFRRKLHVDTRNAERREFGVAIESYGWCSLWDGKASHWTAYA